MESISLRLTLVLIGLLTLVAPVHAENDPPANTSSWRTNAGNAALFDPAFDTGPADNLDQLVKQLSKAVDRLARYRVPKAPPKIYRVPHHELENYVCNTHCAIKAWYKPGDGIFLDESLNPESNLFHRSILLHELVHYFQDQAGEYGNMDPCNRWFHRELDAYTVQNRYLGVIGHNSRVAYTGDNCANMEAAAGKLPSTQVFNGVKGRVEPDLH